MKIEGNETEIKAMQEFHKGNRAEGLRIQEEFASAFREEYKIKITALVKKHADIMEIVKSASRSIGLIRNMFLTVCGLLSMQR